jgi:O-antigen/teichoic acid export membrane protein
MQLLRPTGQQRLLLGVKTMRIYLQDFWARQEAQLDSWGVNRWLFNRSPKFTRLRVHPVIRDLFITGSASGVSFAANLALIAVFGRLLGVTILAEYLLLRRVAAWLQPLSQLGLGVALPRYVAYATNDSQASRLSYFAAAVICILSFGLVLGVLFGLARQPLSQVLFGSAEMAGLMLPLFLLIASGAVQSAVYGFYRGCLNMKRAGTIQICVALVPIVSAAALFRTRSVYVIVSAIACSVITVTAAFGIPIVRELWKIQLRGVHTHSLELLRYGVPRVPGDLGNGALLAVGPVIALHFAPISRVSYLLLALSMLTAASVSTEPVGTVFLSKISMMLACNRTREVQNCLSHLVSATLDLSFFLTIQLIVFADVLVRAWIGVASPEGVAVIRVLLLGTPFYLFYTALRSSVDAGTTRPLNSRNVITSLLTLLVIIALDRVLVRRDLLLLALAASSATVFALLACLTMLSLATLYGVRVLWKNSTMPIICSAVSGAIALIYHDLANVSLPSLAAFELVIGLTCFAVCIRFRVPWFELFRTMIFPNSAMAATVGEPVQL